MKLLEGLRTIMGESIHMEEMPRINWIAINRKCSKTSRAPQLHVPSGGLILWLQETYTMIPCWHNKEVKCKAYIQSCYLDSFKLTCFSLIRYFKISPPFPENCSFVDPRFFGRKVAIPPRYMFRIRHGRRFWLSFGPEFCIHCSSLSSFRLATAAAGCISVAAMLKCLLGSRAHWSQWDLFLS